MILLLVPLLMLGCSGDDKAAEPAVSPNATFAASTPRPGSTAVPGATASPPPGLDSYKPTLRLSGAFRFPQTTEVTNTVELPERPKAQFAEWDGVSVMIYDTVTGEAYDFGPGNLWLPAFGQDHLVFTSDNDVYVVDLGTMEKHYVAHGILAYALGDDYIVINPGDNNFYAIRVDTGARVPLKDIKDPLLRSMLSQRWGGAFQARWFDGSFVIRLLENPKAVCEGTGPEQRTCLANASSEWLVENVWTDDVKLALKANMVEPAGPGEIVLATTPLCNEAGRVTECYDVLAKLEAQSSSPGSQVAVDGTTNIFLVDLTTGKATFVATASYNAVTGQWPMNWPLVANKDYVAWTESYCGDPAGKTRLYDRATGTITELNTSDWLALADGRLGLGEQGATAIIDPATLQYLSVLPEVAGVSWSPDLRYAAVGQGFGRSSVCQ